MVIKTVVLEVVGLSHPEYPIIIIIRWFENREAKFTQKQAIYLCTIECEKKCETVLLH